MPFRSSHLSLTGQSIMISWGPSKGGWVEIQMKRVLHQPKSKQRGKLKYTRNVSIPSSIGSRERFAVAFGFKEKDRGRATGLGRLHVWAENGERG